MSEVDALIVRNLGDLDGAVARLENELEKQIGKELNATVERWAEKEGWAGLFDWYGDEDDIFVAAPEWRGEDEEDETDYDFWFSLMPNDGQRFDDPNGDQFWLTSMCRVGRTTLGLRSYHDTFKYPKGRKWKAKIEPFVQDFIKLGFIYEDKTGELFLPLSIEQERLARAVENEDLSEALAPITVTLDRLIQAKPIINQLRASARNPK